MEVITTHLNADFDSLASMLAAKKLYPKARLAFPGSQEKSMRDFFIQSTIYVFQVEKLKNIELEKINRLIMVDTRQASRIGKFAEIKDKKDLDIHIYDHHPPSYDDISGSLEVIKEVGSTTTILTQIIKDRNIEISPEEATIMALGIYEDTGSFTFSSTTSDDHLAASYLLSKGANLNTVSDMLVKELTAEELSLLNELVLSATSHNINGIDVVIAKASADKYIGDVAVLVHKLKDMKNINVLFVLTRMEDRVYLICRSRINYINVSDIAIEFGGGGHSTAASATIRDLTLIQAEEKLMSVLYKKIGTQIYAKDIMSFPVKIIDSAETLQRAGRLLTRYNINSLPVIKGSKLVGLISRQIIEKATYHGLQDLPTEEYMSTDFLSVTPESSFLTIKNIIIENNQRFLPVMENDCIVGAVTRTDLLRIMQQDLIKDHSNLYSFDYNPNVTKKKSVAKLMKERLDNKIIEVLQNIGKKAEDLHYNAYLVGGIVRDIMLRHETLDIDIVVEGDGIELAKQFAKDYTCKLTSHEKFGTATLIFPGNFRIDIATARLEYYKSPAALPTVELSSIKLDLYRRDFTMNTLAIRLNPTDFGELIDFFGGQKDIKEKAIRVIHNLSFVEDPTRIFRAIRFEQRFGFQIGKHTSNLINNVVKMNFLDQLDGYRFFSELKLIFQEEEPMLVIKRLAEFDILRFIHPKINFNESMKNHLQNSKEIISWFDLLYLEEKYEKWQIYFFGLLDSLNKQEILKLCQRLSITEKNTQKIILAIEQSNTVLKKLAQKNTAERSKIYNLLRPMSIEALLFAMAKTDKNYIKKAISLYFTQLKRTNILLTGEDIKGLGITPGKIYKRIMDDLLEAKLDGIVKTKEEEINFIRVNYIDSLS
ncbi:MAG: CBS domain-containing protein [Pseudomonadota bacterium]